MTWHFYLTDFHPPAGYWSMTNPVYVNDRWLTSIEADECPAKTPFEMQADQVNAMARMFNPYQG